MDAGFQAELMAHRRAAARHKPLTAAEETTLFTAWWDRRDQTARERILAAHARLVVSMAARSIGYGLPLADLISEGHVGLIEGFNRFRPDMGARFATYAQWWIRHQLSNYVLGNWSMVSIGPGSVRRRLFFRLRQAKQSFGYDGPLDAEQAAVLARHLDVGVKYVLAMDGRMAGGDVSLNRKVGDAEDSTELLDFEADTTTPVEDRIIAEQVESLGTAAIAAAMDCLNARERDVLTARRLREDPPPLRSLAEQYGVSVERIRQIEVNALQKLTRRLQKMLPEHGLRADDLVPAA